MRQRSAFALFVLTLSGCWTIVASAQDTPSSLPQVVHTSTNEVPISPATSPGEMNLDACIDLGFRYQPALDAARASVAAAHTGKRSIDKLILPRLFAKDIGIRAKQACHGVRIAEAGLTQAEWDTRYAITRNFFTVQYIRSQRLVVDEVLGNLVNGKVKAKRLFDSGNVDVRITPADLDALDVQIALVKGKKSQIENGMLKALAALREAIGVAHDFPLEIAVVELPSAVYPVTTLVEVEQKDADGKVEKKQVSVIQYYPIYKFTKDELIASAIANRGEMIQATSANSVGILEIEAQSKIKGYSGKTFAWGADIHARPIPQGIFNNEYRPGAIGPEMPPFFGGRKADRMQRARDLSQRGSAVVDKTTNLVSLDVEAQYLKWQEAVEDIQNLRTIEKIARALPGKVQELDAKNFTSASVIQANITAVSVRTQLNDEMHIHALALAGLERATAGAFRIYPVPATPTVMLKKN